MPTDDSPDQPADAVVAYLEADAFDAAQTRLQTVRTAPVETQKTTLRELRAVAETRPGVVGQLCEPLVAFLTADDRAVRLSAAKLVATIAAGDADAVVPVVEPLAARLADDTEFYYVRARCAEALGYVGRDRPAAVSAPEILADFRVGLAFDEPEVKAKLAKALECVALGDPGRLRHQVDALAAHLDDERDLVRYHLCTALAAIGCAHPATLADGRAALAARLTDDAESPYVRGRAAEALGCLGVATEVSLPAVDSVALADADAAAFLRPRLTLLRDAAGRPMDGATPADVGTLASLRESTEAAVEAMTTPDGDACPHCGLALPESGPPMCPRCGAPT